MKNERKIPMKKLLVPLLCLCLLAPSAFCETRERAVLMEGETETIVETLYQHPENFFFWYPEEYFAVSDISEDPGESLLISPADPENTLPVYMEILLPAATGMTGEEFLSEMPEMYGLEEISDPESGVTEGGAQITYRMGTFAPIHYVFFSVRDGVRELQIIAQCPMEAVEGYGHRMDQIVWTIGFQQP